MNKNYYELLEVNEKASPETIEKVYKILAKKYHPDLQPVERKTESEEMFKLINTAYETLSNPKLRSDYDKKLSQEKSSKFVSIEEYKKLKNEYNHLQQLYNKNINNTKNLHNTSSNNKPENMVQYVSNMFNASNTSHTSNASYSTQNKSNMPNSTKRNHIFTIKLPKLKDLLIIILTVLIAITLLSIIPFTRNYFINLYNEFPIIKILVTVINGIIQGILKTFEYLFN